MTGTVRVHHLQDSRSQRILWLLEEASVDYEVIRYERDPKTRLAPSELREVHPLGKSPMIEVDGRLVTESGAIVEWLCAAHAPQMIPDVGTDAHIEHLEWMHFAEGSAMMPILLDLYTGRLGEAAAPLKPRIEAQLTEHFEHMENGLRFSGHYVLDTLSAADIMLSFPAEVAVKQGRAGEKLTAFVEAIHARPTWRSALKRGGSYAFA